MTTSLDDYYKNYENQCLIIGKKLGVISEETNTLTDENLDKILLELEKNGKLL